ncbi:MFS transporter [Couchioplanes caeruleus]|uniref:MFS transporter n=2 Tax=Couchioplanes caeruleus TaxID=56438 RepID=A0A1K0GUB2_9ACTN|nr:MFS transporter [Couchioplanes caeruleus]OJF16078.1 MFS transporter [Couchioplanes caeruleus subsp. caeruleus]ROP29968.1 putative MFS family arabinose efflux permease [Couchioplanes caeruleus]
MTSSPRWAVAGLALSMLLSSIGTSIANVALPTLADAFDASFPAVQWVVLTYLLAITVAIVGAGRLGDTRGRRRVLSAGTALFTVASVLCGIAPTLGTLIAARALQGLGAAVLMALTVALLRDTVPRERTGSAMGLLGTMSAVGTALGPSLGGLLLAGPGWRSIFGVLAPLGVLNLVLIHRHLPADHRQTEDHDSGVRRTLLLAVGLGAYSLAVTIGAGGLTLVLLAAIAVGLLATPALRSRISRDPALSSGLATNTLVSTVMMTTLVVGPFYLSRALGLDEALTGLVMSAGPIVSALTGVPAGRVVDRRGAPFTVLAGLGAMAAGALALTILPALWGLAGYLVATAVLTPGYQLFQAANNTAVMLDVRPGRRGAVSGMLTLSRNLGLITGASAMGTVFAYAMSTTDLTTASPGDVASGMRVAFATSTALIAVAVLITVAGAHRPADPHRRPLRHR